MADCKKCMESAPYPFCCGFECMEHTFCVGCNYKNKFRMKCTTESKEEKKVRKKVS